MKLKLFPPTLEFASLVPLSLFTSSSSSCFKRDRTVSLVLSSSFVSKNPLMSQSSNKIKSRGRTVRRPCSSNLDEIDHEESSFHVEGLPKNYGQMDSEEKGGLNRDKKVNFSISKRSPLMGRHQDSFLHWRFDFLESMMLGIRPDHETVMWANIEQKAKSLDIPLSLRMIKKKLQWEESLAESKEWTYCSVKAAFASMVYIVVELQSYALQMREALCHEDLDVIINKVQKEMNSSFVWLFQQVFSRTPTLMIYVIILLANFSVYSASNYVAIAETSLSGVVGESTIDILSTEEKQSTIDIQSTEEKQSTIDIQSTEEKQSILVSESGEGIVVGKAQIDDPLESVEEMNLWNSIVDEATKMRGVENEVISHETMQHFVSPVSVEIEPDDVYEDFLRTDLLYQMNLSNEPNNPLLLCNYAQFLHLVARDYDRAEECFKRAVQILPPDAECLILYANFLWTVRRDVWGAEERFLQALAAAPKNCYYASRYANFLWNTGGAETCFPPNNSHNSNL